MLRFLNRSLFRKLKVPSLPTGRITHRKTAYLSTEVPDARIVKLYRSFSTVTITYIEPNGEETEVEAEIGKNVLDIAQDNNIELEGACGGELACATCHVVFEKDLYDNLPEKEEEEEDMLDLAFELTETSRLGCQIKVREDFSGTTVRIPDDGF
eukprot:CAMPEP_0194146958 /NCGR_PEP_ID=MMETSP0152-20130528/22434_1 /TAXON_ID=1049557 /ORGANISM="Thalassiothrix antarctica, Strain L6-D1" /LENGTH=153 /DNA_ID=CAMNT_0038847617 /DNA_START=127 /DNA_END=588 /DNA_ORIENTATION=+